MPSPTHVPGFPELSVFAADGEFASSPPPAPYFYLEIRRGKTAFPERPVCSRNYLIGSGPACDLRLGGSEIPEVHSALVVDDEEIHLQWLGEAPPVFVNGEPSQEGALRDGDQINVGRFEFIVHRPLQDHPAAAAQTDVRLAPAPEAEPLETPALMNLLAEARQTEEATELSDVTAAELVARLEAEETAVAEFEAGREQGAEALLYVLAQRVADLQDQPADGSPAQATPEPILSPTEPVAEEEELLEEIERVVQQLSGFSDELDRRAKRLAEQEAVQAEAAELLLDAQHELTTQLERFHQQVTNSVEDAPPPPLRKVA